MRSTIISSYEFVHQKSIQYNIDDSHNHEHSKEVLYYAHKIVNHLISKKNKISESDIHIITQCCLLHDMIDAKYYDFTNDLLFHLKYLYQDEYMIQIMMKIMRTISYSKTFIDNKIRFPEWIDESEYKTVYHIVREADLLSSYNLSRMIQYRLNRFPSMTDAEIRHDVIDLYHERMKRLVDRRFFYHGYSEEYARNLEKMSSQQISLIESIPLRKNLDSLRTIPKNMYIHNIADEWQLLI